MNTSSLVLEDVTNLENVYNSYNNSHKLVNNNLFIIPEVVKQIHCHNPYNWNCIEGNTPLDIFESSSSESSYTRENEFNVENTFRASSTIEEEHIENSVNDYVIVQFKCHQSTYKTPFNVLLGEYVVVQGDRGIDIGVATHIFNKHMESTLTNENTSSQLLRYATQREVDYWALDLKDAEESALLYCRRQILKSRIDMNVMEAEFQFDKKKLTFYYEAATRVDFKQLLKVLHKEYGCRIWMELVDAKNSVNKAVEYIFKRKTQK